MDLYEYQARELFERYGVPVLDGIVATTPQQARAAAERIGKPVMVKAQVKTGGRGKAGGVKLANSPSEAAAAAELILGMMIGGFATQAVMLVEAVNIREEYYLSVLVDRTNRQYLLLATTAGGMDVEQLAAQHPEKIVRQPLDPLVGCDATTALDVAERAGFTPALRPQIANVIMGLWRIFLEEDATLVEVNPLVLDSDGHLHALDGKVTLDDNATKIRHPDHAELVDHQHPDPNETLARELGIKHYVGLAGQVGIIGNGAGLVLSTLDVVGQMGEPCGITAANFLDIGGGANAQVMAAALRVVMGDSQVKSVFVNVFGGITACDQVTVGVNEALVTLGDRAAKPVVVRLDGNAVEQGRALLRAANHPLVHVVETMDDGARLAIELAK